MSAVLFKLNVGQSGIKETVVSRKVNVEVEGEVRVKIKSAYTARTLPKVKQAEAQPVVVEVVEETVEPEAQPHIQVDIPQFETHQQEEYTYEEQYAYEEQYEDIDAEFRDMDDFTDGEYGPFDIPTRKLRIEAAKKNPKLRHKVCMGLNLNPIAIDEAIEYAQADMAKDIKKDIKKAIWNLIK